MIGAGLLSAMAGGFRVGANTKTARVPQQFFISLSRGIKYKAPMSGDKAPPTTIPFPPEL